jgi:peptide/nickel transport system permease protein
MAGSIRGSGIAEPAAISRPSVIRSARGRRWAVLRQAARTRLGPLGVVVMLIAVVVALLAPVISPYDPLKQDLGNTLARPDRAHLMGTDNVGRDVLSRMIWGTRVSLMAGFGSVALAMATGGLLGLLAGYAGGRTDGLVMRLMDAVLSFPPLVLALALGAVLGAGLTGVVIALGVVYTPTFARLMRGQVLTITARDYVEAARALGAPGWRIAWHHVLPNAAAPIVIQASLSVAFAILAEASLSFLGLGIQPPGASWGSMINAGRGYLQQAPWIVFWPGAALFVTVVGLNFVGDAVRDALDPRLRR